MPKEKINVGLVILSILIPLSGLIMFLCWKKEKPRPAKVYGTCALISTVITTIIVIAIISLILVGLKVAQEVGTDSIIEKANEIQKENIILSAEEKVTLAVMSAYTTYIADSTSNENVNINTYMNKELRKAREEVSEEGVELTCSGNIVTLKYNGTTVNGTIINSKVNWSE